MTDRDRAPGEILVVSRQEVEELLTPAECLNRVLDTFRWVGAGEVEQTNPVNLYVHDRLGPEPEFGHGVVQAFPAMIRPLERAAVKWLGSYRQNPRRGLPAISALDLVTDIETGMPLALVDGTSVTNMRTGGHAAVGAKYLARPDSGSVAVIGCGNEGRTHVRALNELFSLSTVVAFDTQQGAAERFAAEIGDLLGVPVAIADSVESAVADVDIVCVVTTAPQPVLMEEWVQPGTHVCAATGFRDVDKACATRFEKWAVGWYGRDLEWIEGPEVGRLGGLQPGDLSAADIYADIATELMPGTKPGREAADERTIMTHMGMPALDAAVAALVYDLALAANAGTWITVF
ncbi:MAG: ornithine cyclodeaminase family protein [Acidimicrobiia bacterium]|nr:ornithine cyclodeaminase family protein [Acidimicrobiia bacterium]NNF08721.1 ornithine cyclodeaminase family protein [Acidimicrobiia bacterium]